MKDDLFGLDYDIHVLRGSHMSTNLHLYSNFENNPYHRWTLRHWLFDHWDWFKKWKINQIHELTRALAEWRERFIFGGTTK